MVNNAPLDEDKKYVVATSGGRTQYLDAKSEAGAQAAVDQVLAYIKANSPISAEAVQNFVEAG